MYLWGFRLYLCSFSFHVTFLQKLFLTCHKVLDILSKQLFWSYMYRYEKIAIIVDINDKNL